MWYLCKRTIVFWYLRCNLDGIMKNQELHFIIILKGSKKLFKFYNFCIDLVKSKIRSPEINTVLRFITFRQYIFPVETYHKG